MLMPGRNILNSLFDSHQVSISMSKFKWTLNRFKASTPASTQWLGVNTVFLFFKRFLVIICEQRISGRHIRNHKNSPTSHQSNIRSLVKYFVWPLLKYMMIIFQYQYTSIQQYQKEIQLYHFQIKIFTARISSLWTEAMSLKYNTKWVVT